MFLTTRSPASPGALLAGLVHLKHETDVWFEVTSLLIPGENDSAAEIEQECQWLADHLGVDAEAGS